jgi:hypothetical protein
MKIWHSAARLATQTIKTMALSRWILALAIIGAGLLSLTVASHVRGATAALEHARSTRTIKVIVPPSAESTRAAPVPSGAQPPPPAFSDVTFRFGFLEFEDDAHAQPR